MSNAFYDLDAQIRWNQETRELIEKLRERIEELERKERASDAAQMS